jgi:hypothetical protein
MLEYTPCKANLDVWIKAMVCPDDGFKYYAYILLYADEVLCIHHDAETAIRQLDKYFPMKSGSIGDEIMEGEADEWSHHMVYESKHICTGCCT